MFFMQNDKNRNLFYSIYNFISIDRPMKTVLKHQTGFNMVIVVNQSPTCLLVFLTITLASGGQLKKRNYQYSTQKNLIRVLFFRQIIRTKKNGVDF